MVEEQFTQVQRKIEHELEGKNKVSLALDTWTSQNKLSFIAITAYVVNEQWEYQEHLLGFEHIAGAHTGENLAKITMQVLRRYHIEHRLFAITADNASNNRTLRRELARKLQQECRLPWDAARHTVPCLTHVVQLVVKEMIQHMEIEPSSDTPDHTWEGPEVSAGARASLQITIQKESLGGVTQRGNKD